jgi:hypothetical protein
MGARQKLNRAFVNGSLLLAGLAGWLLESWLVFLLALVVLLVGNVYASEIRLSRRERLRQTDRSVRSNKRGEV